MHTLMHCQPKLASKPSPAFVAGKRLPARMGLHVPPQCCGPPESFASLIAVVQHHLKEK